MYIDCVTDPSTSSMHVTTHAWTGVLNTVLGNINSSQIIMIIIMLAHSKMLVGIGHHPTNISRKTTNKKVN